MVESSKKQTFVRSETFLEDSAEGTSSPGTFEAELTVRHAAQQH